MRIDAPLPPWWREIFKLSRPIPARIEEQIVAAGDGGLRAVCAVLDPEFGERPVPRPSSDACEACAQLLRLFARPELVPWTFELMRRHGDDSVVPFLAESIAACGPAAAAAACGLFAESEPGDELRPWFAEIVAHAGSRTDESLAVLVAYLQDDPIHAAGLLQDYGDPAAGPALLVEFDRTVTTGPDGNLQLLTHIDEVIRALDVELDAERAARVDACWDEARRSAIQQRCETIERSGFEAVDRAEPGDPCPCESGATYADCCSAIEAEMAERHRAADSLRGNTHRL